MLKHWLLNIFFKHSFKIKVIFKKNILNSLILIYIFYFFLFKYFIGTVFEADGKFFEEWFGILKKSFVLQLRTVITLKCISWFCRLRQDNRKKHNFLLLLSSKNIKMLYCRQKCPCVYICFCFFNYYFSVSGIQLKIVYNFPLYIQNPSSVESFISIIKILAHSAE